MLGHSFVVVRDDTVGVSTAVSVMSVVQSERQFCPAVDIRACFTTSLPGGGGDLQTVMLLTDHN